MSYFSIVMPEIKTAGQVLVKKLGPNFRQVMGTVTKADIEGLKFNDLAKAVEGIEGAVVKELPNGHKVVKLEKCCKLQGADIPKKVVVSFNKDGDCLMLSGAGTEGRTTQGFSLRTEKGIDALLDAGVKNPGARVSTVIDNTQTGKVARWYAENSGTPSQDVIRQAYEYPHLGRALHYTEK